MIKDRIYQEDHIGRISEACTQYRKVLMQLPTGGGKTVEFTLMAQRYTRSTGKAVLILVNRQELMYQAQKTIKKITGIDACLITSQSKHYYISQIYIGMVESTVRRLDLFHNVGLVIIDECHMANFNKVHGLFLEETIIGCSATPISSSKKEPMKKYYQCIVTGPQIRELINMGFLSQNITRCPRDIVDMSKVEVDKMKGDFNERQMANEYRIPKHVVNVIKSYRRLAKGQKTIVFNVNIDHSKEVNECFNFFGINSRHLDSTQSDEERAATIKWFAETPDAVLNNVGIATMGFDEPTIQTVILNFATLSLVKYIQCCGRGSRRIDEDLAAHLLCKPKSFFNIIDLGGNCMRFGDWNDDRDWEYIFMFPEKPGEGVAPVKTCPNCEGLVHAATRVCTLETAEGEICMHEFEKKVVKEQDLEEMILITKGIDIPELIGKHKKKYEYFTFFELGHDVVKNMIGQYGDTPSEEVQRRCFKVYYGLCCDWYSKSMAGKDGNMDSIEDSGWHLKRARNNFNDLVKKLSKTEGSIKQETPYNWNTPEFLGDEKSLEPVPPHPQTSFEEIQNSHRKLLN